MSDRFQSHAVRELVEEYTGVELLFSESVLLAEELHLIFTPPKPRLCPECGLIVKWDEEHQPPAWRHTHSVSAWCDGRGVREPHLPRGAHKKDRYGA